MQVIYENSRFIAKCSFDEKDIAKSAGFRWDADHKQWWTDKAVLAARLKDYADADALREIDQVETALNASRSANAASSISIPAPDGKSYFPYQHAGIAFASARPATLIGDEMGLGKTIQAVGVINATKPEKTLIVCPATLKLNWKKELERWLVAPLRIHVLQSGERFPVNVEIVIMNYDIAAKYADVVRGVKWDLIVCDEAHYLKNPKAKRTVSLIGDGKKDKGVRAARRILMTGTPITNRPVELWPLVSYLFPEQFSNFFSFARRYCNAHQNGYGWDFSGASNLEELQDVLRAAGMIRRLKSHVLTELPPKTRQIVALPSDTVAHLISKEQSMSFGFMEEIERLEQRAAIAKRRNDGTYEAAVAALRQAHQTAFTEMAAVRRELAVAKIPLVCAHLEDMLESGDKVVVMAHHREVVDALQTHFGACAVKLYGGMPDGEKNANVERFQGDPGCRVFVGSIHAAGVGITLTAASKVVFAELDWTPANMLQAEDRCHRIGQRDNVLIQQLVFDGSLDAKMAETLVRKMEVIDRALDTTHA